MGKGLHKDCLLSKRCKSVTRFNLYGPLQRSVKHYTLLPNTVTVLNSLRMVIYFLNLLTVLKTLNEIINSFF